MVKPKSLIRPPTYFEHNAKDVSYELVDWPTTPVITVTEHTDEISIERVRRAWKKRIKETLP